MNYCGLRRRRKSSWKRGHLSFEGSRALAGGDRGADGQGRNCPLERRQEAHFLSSSITSDCVNRAAQCVQCQIE